MMIDVVEVIVVDLITSAITETTTEIVTTAPEGEEEPADLIVDK